MTHQEIESFLLKFRQLWHAGIKASLTIKADAGEATIELSAGLGKLPPPSMYPPYGDREHGRYPYRKRRGPSYERRQQRRQVARSRAEQVPVQDLSAHEADNAANAVIAADQVVENTAEANEETIAPCVDEITVEVKSNYVCLICYFSSNWENGLNVHMTRKHADLVQIDGNDTFNLDNDDSGNDKKYQETMAYWKTGNLGRVYQSFLDVNEIIEESGFNEAVKQVEKDKALASRKEAFGEDYPYVPPWKK